MPKFSVDDRGNVVYFYEEYEDGTFEQVARLDREAGPPGDVDSVTSWNGGGVVTEWAKQNGYAGEIATALEAVMAGTAGEIDYAVRRAFNKLDEWNDVTQVAPKFSSYYYELQAVVEDAVHCGFQRALGQEEKLPSEGRC